MKKNLRIIKRVLSLLLVFLLSINNFATEVADNDGSAFITKAEFDALKSNFQSQIDTYNQNIDSKIDGAIASYLGGIKIKKDGTLNSLVYKINDLGVMFVDDWDLPYTSKGLHRKVGAFLVYASNSMPLSRKNAVKQVKNSNATGWYYDQIKGADGYWYDSTSGYEVIKMGLHAYNKNGTKISGSYDILKVHEADVIDTTRVFKINRYNSQPYVCENYIFDLCPVTTITATSCGGSWNHITIPFDAEIETTYPDHVVKVPTADHGLLGKYGQSTGTWTVTWHGVGVNANGTYTQDVPYAGASSCEETRNTPSLIGNLSTLSGGAVPNAAIYYVNYDEWGIPATTAMATDDKYTYVWQAAAKKKTDTTSSSYLECYGDRANPQTQADRKASDYGLPVIKTWNYKINNNLYYKDLLWYDASIVTNKSIKYYTGVPLCDSTDDYKIKVELNFDLSDASTTGVFAIRKAPFNNSALESTNVTLFQYGTKTPYNDFNINNSSKVKKFEIDAKKGETYWIKITPSSGKQITVRTAESFQTVKED